MQSHVSTIHTDSFTHSNGPNTKCFKDCSELLRLVKYVPVSPENSILLKFIRKHKFILRKHVAIESRVVSCTIDFADAVEKSVRDLKFESSTLKLALASQDVHSLQQFMTMKLPDSLRTWTKARNDMETVSKLLSVCTHMLIAFFRSPGTSRPSYLRMASPEWLLVRS